MKVPKPSPTEDEEKLGDNSEIPLPQTLVRIPIESQTEVLQAQNGTGKNSEGWNHATTPEGLAKGAHADSDSHASI